MTATANTRTLRISEKVTCVAQTPVMLLGGFQGGIYQEALGWLRKIGQVDAPVSFIALAPSEKPQIEQANRDNQEIAKPGISTGFESPEAKTVSVSSSVLARLSIDDLILGTWKGTVIMRNIHTQVSEYPIKYIVPIKEDILAVSDSLRVYLVRIGQGVISSLHIGTYALEMYPWMCYSSKTSYDSIGLTVITGYTLTEMEIVNGTITARKTTNIQEETQTTETITCLTQQPNEYICGTIGGHLLLLETGVGSGNTPRIELERKLTREKVCDILPVSLSSEMFYICITPTTFLVLSSCFQIVWQKCLTDAHSLMGVRRSGTSPLLFFVADTNCQVHAINLEGIITPQTQQTVSERTLDANRDIKETGKSHDEAYLELLDEINTGMI